MKLKVMFHLLIHLLDPFFMPHSGWICAKWKRGSLPSTSLNPRCPSIMTLYSKYSSLSSSLAQNNLINRSCNSVECRKLFAKISDRSLLDHCISFDLLIAMRPKRLQRAQWCWHVEGFPLSFPFKYGVSARSWLVFLIIEAIRIEGTQRGVRTPFI